MGGYLGAVLHVGPAVEQQADHLGTPLEARQRQCRVAIGLDLRVDVRAHVQQQHDGGDVAVHGRQHEGGDPQLTARPGGHDVQGEGSDRETARRHS